MIGFDAFLVRVDQMKKWKSWESETSSLEYEFTNGNLFILLTSIVFEFKDVKGDGSGPCDLDF